MEKGMSFETHYISKYLEPEEQLEIQELVLENKNVTPTNPTFDNELSTFFESLTPDAATTIRRYTGYDFIYINAVLRNNWTYEKNGKFSEEKQKEYLRYAEALSDLIRTFPETKTPFMTYRGTTIDEFKKYNISSIEELINLKGKFIYETGFTSTSIHEEKSYYNKDINNSIKNIEIRYIIPATSQDGMPLLSDELSYSMNQDEYVLDRNSLSMVVDVNVHEDTAILTVVLIPKKIWDKAKEVKQQKQI